MENGRLAIVKFGLGEPKEVIDNLNKPLNTLPLKHDITQATRALVLVTGSPKLTVSQAEQVIKGVSKSIVGDQIVWGASINRQLSDEMQVMVLVIGVDAHGLFKKPSVINDLVDRVG